VAVKRPWSKLSHSVTITCKGKLKEGGEGLGRKKGKYFAT
jgi:hypothetical protein